MFVVKFAPDAILAASGTSSFEDFGFDIFKY